MSPANDPPLHIPSTADLSVNEPLLVDSAHSARNEHHVFDIEPEESETVNPLLERLVTVNSLPDEVLTMIFDKVAYNESLETIPVV